eukprot:2139513-Pleurochrysis_carterae.AAC.1
MRRNQECRMVENAGTGKGLHHKWTRSRRNGTRHLPAPALTFGNPLTAVDRPCGCVATHASTAVLGKGLCGK